MAYFKNKPWFFLPYKSKEIEKKNHFQWKDSSQINSAYKSKEKQGFFKGEKLGLISYKGWTEVFLKKNNPFEILCSTFLITGSGHVGAQIMTIKNQLFLGLTVIDSTKKSAMHSSLEAKYLPLTTHTVHRACRS